LKSDLYISKKIIDRVYQALYFVIDMNEIALKSRDDLLVYQTCRLEGLINEMLECCEDRKLYETQRFLLPFAEIKCLMQFDGERYLTVKGLAQRLDVAKSRITKLVDSLIEKGFLERIDDPKDARVKLISVTPEGERKSKEIDMFRKEIHRKILLQLDLDERNNMLSYLERLRSAMEAVKETLL
jgi:DNA-binding MarR family transcriptional regulator